MTDTRRGSKQGTKKTKPSENREFSVTQKSSNQSSCSARLLQIELNRFCPRKFFHILLVLENDTNSINVLNSIEETSREYEKLASLTFISSSDVMRLIDNDQDLIFPNQVKPILLDVIDLAKRYPNGVLPIDIQAQLLKLKIVEIMYSQYVGEVKTNQKDKLLDDLLNILSKECRKKTKGKDAPVEKKSPGQDDAKKKLKQKDIKQNEEEDIDYTLISLEKDEINFDEDIYNHIWFYVIRGFNSIEVLKELIEYLNVPILSVVNISNDIYGGEYSNDYWKYVISYFQNIKNDFLQNTFLMNWNFSDKVVELNQMDAFQEFLLMVRSTIDTKINHLNYIRHLKLNKIEEEYPVIPIGCLSVYKNFLEDFPLECISECLLFEGLLKEINYRLENSGKSPASSVNIKTTSSTSSRSFSCLNPLNNIEDAPKQVYEKHFHEGNPLKGFLTHDENLLFILFKCYESIGKRLFDIQIESMSRALPFARLFKCQINVDQILHKHDLNPSWKFVEEKQEMVDHFMYLFLFSTFQSDINNWTMENPEWAKFLQTFDLGKYWEGVQLKESKEIVDYSRNLYEELLTNYYYSEKLSSEVLLQNAVYALLEFSYMDTKYSPETDSVLIKFSNKLDTFGTHSKIYEAQIRTPICLRDFCMYTIVSALDTDWLSKCDAIFKPRLSLGAESTSKANLKLFEEYAYLLEEECELPETIDVPEPNRSNFESIYQDLMCYPTNEGIMVHCGTVLEDPLLAYDLGSNIFKITGAETTFISHDGVKVLVDNTRFNCFDDKCTFNVSCNGHTFIIHSSKKVMETSVDVNVSLKNGSRISFIIEKNTFNIDANTKLNMTEVYSEEDVNQISADELIFDNLGKQILSVDEDYFNKILSGKAIVDEMWIQDDENELLKELKRALEQDEVIYKVNPNTHYLDRRIPETKIPPLNLIQQIVPKEVYSRKCAFRTSTKRYMGNKKLNFGKPMRVDFRICLPNGLFIRSYMSLIPNDAITIKQEYTARKPKTANIDHEEFRLFTNQGLILIKKVDGSITILRSNGDIIEFEKPIDDTMPTSLKPCRCKTVQDYRKMLIKIFSDNENESDYYPSRRAHLKTKHGVISDEKIIKVLKSLDVPYIKKSVIRLDGRKIKITENKVSEKQIYHLITESNFSGDTIYSERSDDLRSIFVSNGSQQILFPDKTLICSSVNVSNELVDGFVYVSLDFQYAHPNYASVKYDFDNSVEISLNNEFVIRKKELDEKISLSLEDNISISVSSHEAKITKTCVQCLGKCKCSFNLELFSEQVWNPTANFLHVHDSYNKHFYADLTGRCSRNSEYVEGPKNVLGCDHSRRRVYNKLFVVNSDLSGNVIWSNKYVENFASKECKVNNYILMSNKYIPVIDYRKEIHETYCHRFNNHNCRLSKNNQVDKPQTCYTTFRVFRKMISFDDIKRHVSNLQKMFFNEFVGMPSYNKILIHLAGFIKDVDAIKEEQGIGKKFAHGARDSKEAAKCLCIKRKKSMQQKIETWRAERSKYFEMLKKRDIPKYFDSGFCKLSI